MDFYLSTVADLDAKIVDDEIFVSDANRTLPFALEYGLGLEIADFCTPENLEEKFDSAKEAVSEKVKKLISNNGEKFQAYSPIIFHAPYNELYPTAIDSKVREVAWQRYEQAVELAKHFGARKIVIHAGWVKAVYYKNFFIKQSIKFWKDFLNQHPGNYIICLENVMENEPDFLTDIVSAINDPRLRICVDIGHANVTGTPPETWLKETAPWLSHLHVHNNNGIINNDAGGANDLHLPPGEGVMDVAKLLNIANDIDPEITATIEAWNLEDSCKWLKENSFI